MNLFFKSTSCNTEYYQWDASLEPYLSKNTRRNGNWEEEKKKTGLLWEESPPEMCHLGEVWFTGVFQDIIVSGTRGFVSGNLRH